MRSVIPDEEVARMQTYWQSHQHLLVPHRECKHNCACCGGCDMAVRTDADFIASRLVAEHTYSIADEKALLQFLVQMGPAISNAVKAAGGIQPSLRLYNCIKIKFLRKSMLARSFKLDKQQYQKILEHPRFLKQN